MYLINYVCIFRIFMLDNIAKINSLTEQLISFYSIKS